MSRGNVLPAQTVRGRMLDPEETNRFAYTAAPNVASEVVPGDVPGDPYPYGEAIVFEVPRQDMQPTNSEAPASPAARIGAYLTGILYRGRHF